MKKQTAFYVASATLASAFFLTDISSAEASTLTLQPGFELLPNQASIQTIDFKEASATRTINFSLPVDPSTIEGNITLFDVTAKKEITIIPTVHPSNAKAVTYNTTHEEGHEYRLLINKQLKSIGQTPLSLQQAIQFHYVAKNVNVETKVEGTISSIKDGHITIDGTTYTASKTVEKAFANNVEILKNADIAVTISNNIIQSIEAITINENGTKEHPLTFNGANAALEKATITIAGDYVAIDQATFKHLLVAGNVSTQVHVNESNITGKAEVLAAERTPQAEAEATQSSTLTIVFNDSTVVEMTIARVNVHSEISGSSTFQMIAVHADCSIWSNPDVILPKLTLENGVTNIALNASIASVVVKADNDIKVTGSGNFEKVNVETTKQVELATTGTIKEIAVPNKETVITLGDNVKIETVTLPDNVTIEEIVNNYEDVKDNINVDLTEEDKVDYLAAKLLPTDIEGVATVSLLHDTTDAVYIGAYVEHEESSLDVGDTLTGTEQKWSKDTKVPIFNDILYYVYKVNEKNVITEKFEVQSLHTETFKMTVNNNVATVKIQMKPKGDTLADLVDGFYLSDGKQGKLFLEKELTDYKLQYDDYGIPFVEIPALPTMNFENDRAYYYVDSVGGYNLHYVWITNMPTSNDENSSIYRQAVYDYVNAPMHPQLVAYFNQLLTETNYDLADYTTVDGYTYKTRVSRLSTIPSIRGKYLEAFKEASYTTITDIQKIVEGVNNTYLEIINTYQSLESMMEALYKEDRYSYPYGERLRDNVTYADLQAVNDAIQAATLLNAEDRQQLENIAIQLKYEMNQKYWTIYYNLMENGKVKADVTLAQINEAIVNAQNDIPDTVSEKQSILNSLEYLKSELYVLPIKKLYNTNWQYEAERLKSTVTKEQIDAAIKTVRENATTAPEQLQTNINSEIDYVNYLYVLREAQKLVVTAPISIYQVSHLHETVTESDIDAIFEAVDFNNTTSYGYSIDKLQKQLYLSLRLKDALTFVNTDYLNSDTSIEHIFKENASIEQFKQVHETLQETYKDHDQLLWEINNWFNKMYDYYYKQYIHSLYEIDIKSVSSYTNSPFKEQVTEDEIEAVLQKLEQDSSEEAKKWMDFVKNSQRYSPIWQLYRENYSSNFEYEYLKESVTSKQLDSALDTLTFDENTNDIAVLNDTLYYFVKGKLQALYSNNTYSSNVFSHFHIDESLSADDVKEIVSEALSSKYVNASTVSSIAKQKSLAIFYEAPELLPYLNTSLEATNDYQQHLTKSISLDELLTLHEKYKDHDGVMYVLKEMALIQLVRELGQYFDYSNLSNKNYASQYFNYIMEIDEAPTLTAEAVEKMKKVLNTFDIVTYETMHAFWHLEGLTSVKDDEIVESAIDNLIEQPFWTTLPSYNEISAFVTLNEYGVTIEDGAAIESLTLFAQQLQTLQVSEENQVTYELLLASVEDAIARAEQNFSSIGLQ